MAQFHLSQGLELFERTDNFQFHVGPSIESKPL
jgi:hypothetical protein